MLPFGADYADTAGCCVRPTNNVLEYVSSLVPISSTFPGLTRVSARSVAI